MDNGRARGDGSCQFTLSDRDYLPLFLFTLPRWRRALVRPRARYPICETDGSDRSIKPIVTLIHLSSLPRFSFLSLFATSRVDFRVDFTGELDLEKLRTNSFADDFEAQMTDDCSTWLSFSRTTLRFYFATFHRSAIHRFLFRRQPVESGFHRSFN